MAWENVKSKSGLSLALVPWTGMEALLGGEAPHSGVAALDQDGDRDLDLVLPADGSAPLAVINDRLGNLVYDYDYVDPAPLARMWGKLTRYGDVACLLQADDDRFCVVGPGDEARLEFEAAGLPPLPAGWTRAYVLRAFGYCKDADPFTATSDTIEPLPWRGMPAFPFAAGVTRPAIQAHDDYLREFQTRPAGGSRAAPGSTLRVKADSPCRSMVTW